MWLPSTFLARTGYVAKRSLPRPTTRKKYNRKSNIPLETERLQAGICTKITSNVLDKKDVSMIL